MAISDEIFIIAVGIAFSYLVLYKKNRILGNIGMAGCGIAMMAFSTGNTHSAIGLIILLGSILNTIYDLIWNK